MPSNVSRQTLTGLSSTAGYLQWFPDWMVRPFSATVAVTGSSATYNVEVSNDYTGGSSVFISSNAAWFSSLASGLVSSGFVSVAVPW
jgi:hypothetical protein